MARQPRPTPANDTEAQSAATQESQERAANAKRAERMLGEAYTILAVEDDLDQEHAPVRTWASGKGGGRGRIIRDALDEIDTESAGTRTKAQAVITALEAL